MNKTCCFTGHRPKSLPFGYDEGAEGCKRLKALLTESIEKQITENGVTHLISGMAMGVDIYAAEAVLELKEKYPHITLECAIPCETQQIAGAKAGGTGTSILSTAPMTHRHCKPTIPPAA